jgi:hypothetical protein
MAETLPSIRACDDGQGDGQLSRKTFLKAFAGAGTKAPHSKWTLTEPLPALSQNAVSSVNN